jgi:iron complex outermembrane recepter protein
MAAMTPTAVICAAIVLLALQTNRTSAQTPPPTAPAAPAASAPEAAASAPGAQTIVITGTKQNKTQEKTAESVQVFTDRDLQKRAITTVNEAIARTPNATVDYGADRFVQIRGFTNSNFNRPAITLTQDGAERDGIGFALSDSLWDVDQFEVLRGSQSTAYGRGAIGGVVSIKTKDPTFTPEAEGRIGFGSYRYRAASAVVSGPLIDSELAARLALDTQRVNIQIPNLYFGSRGTQQEVIRGKLLWTPKALPGLKVLGTLQRSEGGLASINQTYSPFGFGGPLINTETTLANGPGGATFFGDGVLDDAVLDAQYRIDERWKAQLLLSAYDRRNAYEPKINLCYETFRPFVPIDPADCQNFNDRLTGRTRSAEARLNYEHAGVSALLGAYAQRRRDISAGDAVLANRPDAAPLFSYRNQYDVRAEAVFGQLGYAFASQWRVDVAGRFNRERNELSGEPPAIGRFSKFTPELTLTWQPLTTLSLLGTLRRGFRAGGAEVEQGQTEPDPGSPIVSVTNRFDPETADTAEFALRWREPEQKLSLNANVFFTRYDNRQEGVEYRGPDGQPLYEFFGPDGALQASPIFVTGNSARSRVAGLELDATWRGVEGLEVYGGLGLARARYDDFAQADGSNLAGTPIQDFPQRTANLGFDWRVARGWVVGLNATHIGKVIGATLTPRAQTYVGGRIGYESDTWSAQLVGDNLLDKRYVLSEFVFEDGVTGFQAWSRFRTLRFELRARF